MTGRRKNKAQEVRIIGGKWRGRKLRFAKDPRIRPTLGRIRETAFNWLRPYIHGTTCIDLFAGSGILALEALSQGAEHCTAVEVDRRTAAQIQSNAKELDASLTVVNADALAFLARNKEAYDIAFVDPPYERDELLLDALAALASIDQLQYVYAEARDGKRLVQIAVSAGFDVHRETRAGDSAAALLVPVAAA